MQVKKRACTGEMRRGYTTSAAPKPHQRTSVETVLGPSICTTMTRQGQKEITSTNKRKNPMNWIGRLSEATREEEYERRVRLYEDDGYTR